MNPWQRFLCLTPLIIVFAGCSNPTSMPAGTSSPTQVAAEAAKAKQSAPQPAAAPATTEAQPATEMERVKAKVGVGRRGRGLDKFQNDPTQSIISEPARAFFNTKERIVFEIQVPHALDLYKAEHGNAPKTQEEFMQEIIEFNQIPLPELPAGHRYIYDPESEQLMVERPRPSAAP